MINENAKKCSMLMYSHDGFGLGHLKRNFTIAKKAVTEYPQVGALLLMGVHSVPFHPIPYGIDFIKLPSIVKTDHEDWQPRTLPMEVERFKKFRSDLILESAKHYDPDIFLVDYVPKGVWGELLPTLNYLKNEKKNTKIILGLRDIIDEPELTRTRWEKGNAYEVIREYYDKIFIYGSPEVYDTAGQYGLQGDLEKKVNYCGYLCTGEPCKAPKNVKRELGIGVNPLIVITAGGGGDAFPMMRLCMEAIKILSEKLAIEALFITGPLMRAENRKMLEEMAETLPARVLTSSYNLIDTMSAADLLVTMGSYNTMMEAVKLSRPTLVIPREGPSAEQKIRAELFSRSGFVKIFRGDPTTGCRELAEAMERTIGEKPSNLSLNMNGLNETVRLLSEYFTCAPSRQPIVQSI